MDNAISNTSPLLYLYRTGILDWLPKLFNEIWIPNAVIFELKAGQDRGYDVPNPHAYEWITVVEPQHLPSEWLALDLGAGELASMSLSLEHPNRIILLDDMLARRTAQAAGLRVWGTLKVLLEGKSQGLTERIKPHVIRLSKSGMWISGDIRQRILALAGEIEDV